MAKFITTLFPLLLVTACGTPPLPEPAKVAPPTATNTATLTSGWIGRWNGPEGMFLEIAANDGSHSDRYTITNRYSLDAESRFDGLADRDTIVFTRNGQTMRLRAGTGDETGMKWLAGKTDCLIVAPGEGYCRP